MNKMISRNFLMLWLGATGALFCMLGCQCDIFCGKAFLNISYVGYDLAALDTVIVRRFDKTTSGNRLKDSILVAIPEQISYSIHGDTARMAGTNGSGLSLYFLESDWNYEVFIPAAGRTYQISNIVEKQRKEDASCSGCTMMKRNCMNTISSVNIDNRSASVDNSFAIYLSK